MIVPVSLGERSYPIIIESGALDRIADLNLPSAAVAGELFLVSNQRVGPLYAEPMAEQLRAAGRRVGRFDTGVGEAAKSLHTAGTLYDALAEASFSRRGALWAVGGGVTGDLGGYVAATWMRGVAFVQVPTTLLAMVDSSVGGKTGVNHPKAKNLIGAFWQPSAVVIDPNCLRTLDPRELRAGLAEVIKYGVISDVEFFAWLESHLDSALALDPEVLTEIIARCCAIKADVVGEDERESDAIGRRAILNYGHTLGHALEAVTRYGELLHGEAIAIGMTVAARLALQLGVLPGSEGVSLLERQTRLFSRAGLPVEVPEGLDWTRLWTAMTLDKKTRGASVNFILPTRLGEVTKVENVSSEAVKSAAQLR